MIARALAQGADLFLWDEPTSHLDIKHAHVGLRLLRQMGLAGIVVLHDLNLAARYCDRLVVLDKGKIVADGSPTDICQPNLVAEVFGAEAAVVKHNGAVQLLFFCSALVPPNAAIVSGRILVKLSGTVNGDRSNGAEASELV